RAHWSANIAAGYARSNASGATRSRPISGCAATEGKTRRNDRTVIKNNLSIPAKAGIHLSASKSEEKWVPAFAGMIIIRIDRGFVIGVGEFRLDKISSPSAASASAG